MTGVGEFAPSVRYDGGFASHATSADNAHRPSTVHHHPGIRACASKSGNADTQCRSARYAVDAYGTRTVMTAGGTTLPKSTIGFQRGFTGYRLDEETGMYYARTRMYSSQLGHFIGRDSAGYVDGLNLYGGYFAPNGVDPSGRHDEAGHFATTYAEVLAQGYDIQTAFDIALWSQLPDEITELDAITSPSSLGGGRCLGNPVEATC